MRGPTDREGRGSEPAHLVAVVRAEDAAGRQTARAERLVRTSAACCRLTYPDAAAARRAGSSPRRRTSFRSRSYSCPSRPWSCSGSSRTRAVDVVEGRASCQCRSGLSADEGRRCAHRRRMSERKPRAWSSRAQRCLPKTPLQGIDANGCQRSVLRSARVNEHSRALLTQPKGRQVEPTNGTGGHQASAALQAGPADTSAERSRAAAVDAKAAASRVKCTALSMAKRGPEGG